MWTFLMKYLLLICTLVFLNSCSTTKIESVKDIIAANASVQRLATGFKFTEGPANDAKGDIYFTDIPNNHINKWDVRERKLSLFLKDSGGANGLWINDEGKILACQGNNRKVVMIDPKTKSSLVLASMYKGKAFNKPNDLWRDNKGGIYFTDPNYRKEATVQDGEHVYYRSPMGKITRVINDFERPNGVIGTKDGKILYVTDRNGGKTFSYSINEDGSLSNKTKIADVGSDGMTLDQFGNLYVTTKTVEVYSPQGVKLGEIAIPEAPSNICFGGEDGKTLFITARKSLYSLKTNVKGMFAR